MTPSTRRKSNTFYIVLIAGAAALGGFLFGFDTAVINGAVLALSKAFNATRFQQFVGINVIFYYSSVLWRAIGFSEKDSLTITVITGAVNIVTTLIAIAFVDGFGRKPLLILGSIGMTVTLGTLASTFRNAPLDAAGNPTLSGSAGTVAL